MKPLVALLAATLALGTAAAQGRDVASVQQNALRTEIERALAAPGWNGDRWGVLVVSLRSGDTLFAHDAHTSLIPASNMKLFTTAAALKYLGPGYRYSTYLVATGPIEGGVLRGDLLVYGTGDPTISARFFETKTSVWESLADSLSALGIARIEGDLVGDASYFEGRGTGEGWGLGYVTHSYAAPAGALSFNDNVVTLHVTPGATAGAPPEIQMIPAGEVEVVNQARTVQSGRSRIVVERESYDAPIVVTGQIQRGQSAGQWRAVPVVDPAHFSATAFRDILAKRGIQVGGTVRSVRDASASAITPRTVFAPSFEDTATPEVLVVHRSPALMEILKVINQRSHNLYAEAVLRTVGRVATGHGSVAGGAAAVGAILRAAGVEEGSVQMADGSGLSTLNRVTAASIVQVLAYMEGSPYWDAYWETLPEAAVSRGLRRMQETAAASNLRAKTGTIDRVSALSGYVHARNGERLAFAIISNDVPSTWTAKRVEDRIGARLASFDRPLPSSTARLAASDDPAAAPSADSAGRVQVATAEPGSDEEAEATGPSADAAAAATPDSAARESGAETYTIQKGDTLDGIARRHGVALAALQEANPDVNPRRLMPGDRIRLPAQ